MSLSRIRFNSPSRCVTSGLRKRAKCFVLQRENFIRQLENFSIDVEFLRANFNPRRRDGFGSVHLDEVLFSGNGRVIKGRKAQD